MVSFFVSNSFLLLLVRHLFLVAWHLLLIASCYCFSAPTIRPLSRNLGAEPDWRVCGANEKEGGREAGRSWPQARVESRRGSVCRSRAQQTKKVRKCKKIFVSGKLFVF